MNTTSEEKIISRDALIDDRPQVLKDKDYSTEEVASAAAVKTFDNKQIKKITIPEFNQWYVGSCVPHGIWTQLMYEGIVDEDFNPSQLRTYRKRYNYPGAGSIGTDIYDKIKEGQSNDFPTPAKFREADATAMPYVKGEKLIKDFTYYQYLDKKTYKLLLDQVPADVAQGKAVAIFIYATDEEWSKEYVEVIEPDYKLDVNSEVRHCVCIIPKGDFTRKGKRWLAVQDSAKFGGRGLRYIEYDQFFLNRCYFAAKVYAGADVPPVVVPPIVGKPLVPCEIGDKGDQVLFLQKFLIEQGKLEAQYATGYYGALTAKAVLWWQLENWSSFTSNIPQLLEWGGAYWGSQSIEAYKLLTK